MFDQRSELREVGRIVRSHGLCGHIKVAPETDDPNRLAEIGSVFIGTTADSAISYGVESFSVQPSKYGLTMILGLRGISSRDSADGLRSLSVFVSVEDLPPLEPGEYFLDDLVGFRALSTNDSILGTVMDVLELPAQNALLVRQSDGSDRLVPLVSEIVSSIDMKAKTIRIHEIEGLF